MKLCDGKSGARVESMVFGWLLVGAFLSWSFMAACGGNDEGQPFEGEENPGESSDDEFDQVEEVVEPEEIETPGDGFGGDGDGQVPQVALDQNQGSYPGQNPAQGKVVGVGQNPGQGSLVDGKGGKLAGKDKGASQSGVAQGPAQGPYQGQWSGKGEPSKAGNKGVAQTSKGKGVDQSYGGVAQGPEQTYKGGPQQSPYKDKGVSQMGKGGKGKGVAQTSKGKGVDQGSGPAQAPHLVKAGSPSQGGKLAKNGAQQQQSSPEATAALSLPSRYDQMGVSCTQDANYRLVVGGQHFLLNRYVTAFYADEASLTDPEHISGYKDFATIIFNELFDIHASTLASWVVQGGELVQAQGLTFNQDTVAHGSTPVAAVVHGHYSVSRHSVQGQSRSTKFDLAAYGACLALYQSDDGTYLGDQALVLVLP